MTKLIALSQYPSTQSHEKKRGVDASILKRGFTLIEMVVTLSIIAILAVVITTQFSGDSAKAAKLLADAESIRKAALRFKTDTGYYPCSLNALMTKESFDIPHEYRSCSFAGGSQWAGPYLEKGIKTGLDNVEMIITRYQRGWGAAPESLGFPYIVSIVGVPEGIAKEFVKKCSGLEYFAANFTNSKCYVYPFNGDEPRMYHLSYFISHQK